MRAGQRTYTLSGSVRRAHSSWGLGALLVRSNQMAGHLGGTEARRAAVFYSTFKAFSTQWYHLERFIRLRLKLARQVDDICLHARPGRVLCPKRRAPDTTSCKCRLRHFIFCVS